MHQLLFATFEWDGIVFVHSHVSIKTSFFNSRSMVVKERASSHGAIHSSISQLNFKNPSSNGFANLSNSFATGFLKSIVVCSNNPKIGHLVPVLYRIFRIILRFFNSQTVSQRFDKCRNRPKLFSQSIADSGPIESLSRLFLTH